MHRCNLWPLIKLESMVQMLFRFNLRLSSSLVEYLNARIVICVHWLILNQWSRCFFLIFCSPPFTSRSLLLNTSSCLTLPHLQFFFFISLASHNLVYNFFLSLILHEPLTVHLLFHASLPHVRIQISSFDVLPNSWTPPKSEARSSSPNSPAFPHSPPLTKSLKSVVFAVVRDSCRWWRRSKDRNMGRTSAGVFFFINFFFFFFFKLG